MRIKKITNFQEYARETSHAMHSSNAVYYYELERRCLDMYLYVYYMDSLDEKIASIITIARHR